VVRRWVSGVVAVVAAAALTPAAASAQLPQLPPLPGVATGGGKPPPGGGPGAQPPAVGAGGSFGDVVSYRMNPQHTGSTADVSVFGPIFRLWSRHFEGPPNQPLIVKGRVIVNVAASDGTAYGSRVVALNPRNGHQIWSRDTPGTYFSSHIAIDGGRVVSVNVDGVARAFAVADGRPLWTYTVPSEAPFFRGVPVAAGGSVYFLDGGHTSGQSELYALDMRTGALRWRKTVPIDGEAAMPLLDTRRVIMADACGTAVALRRSDGATLWSRTHEGSCYSGAVGMLLHGRVFTPSSYGYTYDASSGAERHRLRGGAPDAAFGGVGARLRGNGIRAIDMTDGDRRWRHGTDSGFDEPLRPIIAGPTVYATSGSGYLIGLSRSRGRLLSRTRWPFESHSAIGGTAPGMSVGHGLLVATGGLRLTGFAPVLLPPARGTDTAATNYDIQAGRHILLGGGLGAKIKPRGGRRVVLERDRYPFKAFSRVGRKRTLADGAVYFDARPRRNTRYRVRLPGQDGKARFATVYAYPFSSHRLRSSGAHDIELRLSMRADSAFHAGGRDLVVYWWRHGAKRMFRVGSGRIDQTGVGRAHVVVVFRRPSHAKPKDQIYWCVAGLRGYGRPTPFYRNCGARHARY
jgi:outer membrane protein assembly factor BamB